MLSISKQQVAQLPDVKYHGRIFIIETVSDARSALTYLSRVDAVGFDTETRPSFQKGHQHTVCLLQLATKDECFLLRLNKIGFTDQLKSFLENPNIVKIGLSTKDDFNSLSKLGSFEPAGFVELQAMVRDWDIADSSLQKIYAIMFGERITKGQRLTNWEADKLTEAQQHYAAIDAWACLKIFNTLRTDGFDPTESPYQMCTD